MNVLPTFVKNHNIQAYKNPLTQKGTVDVERSSPDYQDCP
jgi:hypothetical protein